MVALKDSKDRVIRPTLTAWQSVHFLRNYDPEGLWVLGAQRFDGSGYQEQWRSFWLERADEAQAWIAECYAEGSEVYMWTGDVRQPLDRRPEMADTTQFRFVGAYATAGSAYRPDGFVSGNPAWPHAVYHGLTGVVDALWKLVEPVKPSDYRQFAAHWAYRLCKGGFSCMPRFGLAPLPANILPPSKPGGCLVRAPYQGRTPVPLGAQQALAAAATAVKPVASADPRASQLVRVLGAMGFAGRIKEVKTGPVITQYIFTPESGTRGGGIIDRAPDIAREMDAESCSVASQAGGLAIQLPNVERETVGFQDVLRALKPKLAKMALPVALGKNSFGDPEGFDIEASRHLLVAGASGGGKSVALNTIILSLLYHLSPDQCQFVMIDPKMLELTPYEDIPHLARPVATDVPQAIEAMEWAVSEMLARTAKFKAVMAKSLPQYNAKVPDDALPYIICVVDEYADLVMMDDKKRAEKAIKRVAQMGRALGIYLLVATQKPVREVIDTVIKANFVSRIAFQVVSKTDSGVILDQNGAENLLGHGDALFMYCGRTPYRVHVAYSDDADLTEIIASVKEKYGTADFGDDVDFESADGSLPNVFDTTPMGGGEREAVEGEDISGQTAIEFACRWLKKALAEGPRPGDEIVREAEQAGIKRTTLDRAADKYLGVKKSGGGFGKAKTWSLL